MSTWKELAEAGVSPREAEVLAAIGEHLSNAEIAGRLFVSERTVESHVSSLLRKLGVSKRWALVEVARALDAERVWAALPARLSPFVGRVAECEALAGALERNRLVTAVGPGGVGKTRLAVEVAASVASRYRDGCWFVDLVPVSDPAMVVQAIAGALGVRERRGASIGDALLASLADREGLLVLDNCEHLIEGVGPFLERLLAACPRVDVLATSRVRPVAPFEFVFPVAGLSLPDDDGGGDAVALFVQRARAAGARIGAPEERPQVEAICRAVDGVALAIELAAARVPSMGLDGLEEGLADRLHLLRGGARRDERHRSLRATLDWSYDLLGDGEQALLRRVAVFVAPLGFAAAVDVAGYPPLEPADIAAGLGELADNSLLMPTSGPGGTRFRTPEILREYCLQRLGEKDEFDDTRARHLAWSRSRAAVLERDPGHDPASFAAAFDDAADDLRSALGWASARSDQRDGAYELARSMGGLCFTRGLFGEAQRRFEQASALAIDDTRSASALRLAASNAINRFSCDQAVRLLRTAAESDRRAGNLLDAACDLAAAATAINRFRGGFVDLPSPEEVDALLAEARELATGAPRADAAILVAELFRSLAPDDAAVAIARQAVGLARRSGDLLTESAALDALANGLETLARPLAAARTTRQRVELLLSRPRAHDPGYGVEVLDAYTMAAATSIAAGDLLAARRYASEHRELPFAPEEAHLTSAWALIADALIGRLGEALTMGDRFRQGWEAAGRPLVPYLGRGATAVAMVHGLRGDEQRRAEWLAVATEMGLPPERLAGSDTGYAPTFDALVLLHRGDLAAAVARLSTPPEELNGWDSRMWRQWYAALWAEAASLATTPDAENRRARARRIVVGNPPATAIVDRAAAMAAGSRPRLLAAATALEQAGCRYQWARTLAFAGGEERARGDEMLAEMAAAPMALL